ncbi:protein ALP1-like [Brassica napus]|uniref:protein ALP1-like n=1 Tax=Brassica napus TaxID=3708 RepID=UPI0020791698|nr:protein ALP1-like [Brassica napus]
MELMLLEEEEFLQRYMHPILEYYKTNFFKQPMNKDWGNGWKLIRGQIYHNEVSCRTLIRMSSEAFIRLCEVLQTKYGLQESNNIKVDESVAIFLILCGQNDTQRDIGLRFGHAQETICRKFHYVLGAVVQLAVDYLRPRTTREFEAISNSLHGDKRYSPYFNGFVGALDGTHVPVMVTPGRDALRFVNRKGTASLNVLGICDHDMLFTYCFVGMAGSTHDSRVLDTAMREDPMFPHPPEGKYYLVDSGYANRRGYLAPYRKERIEGTRYHLQDFFNNEPPKNSKEMFNRWHASLRSVIERTFGVWKQKWRVLNEFPRYDISTQRKVIFATMGLHNFIRWNKIKDIDFEEFDVGGDTTHSHSNVNNHSDDESDEQVNQNTSAGVYMKIVRDHIAEQIWTDKRHASRRL